MDLVIIEEYGKDGVKWYLSFAGSNPPSDKCVECADYETVAKLKFLIETEVMNKCPSF